MRMLMPGALKLARLRAHQVETRSGLKLEEALAKIETEIPTDETLQLVAFIRRSERGICRE